MCGRTQLQLKQLKRTQILQGAMRWCPANDPRPRRWGCLSLLRGFAGQFALSYDFTSSGDVQEAGDNEVDDYALKRAF